jgi:ribosomal protein S18 acetylase RimI-like enzyme
MIKASDPNAIRIVLATTEDWDRVRAVRLRALADAPLAYESRWEEEKDRPESFWRGRLERQDAATFLAQADNEAVGLARAFVVPENPAHTELVSMWVAPEARGRCIGRQLVGAVVGWGRQHGATSVGLWVTETNAPARKLYESCGFMYSGERQLLPSHPGLSEVAMRLVLSK